MAGRRLNTIEVWSDLDLAGGSRVGFIRGIDCLSASEFRELNGQDWIRLDLPSSYGDTLAVDQVLRVIEGSGVWREYRIRELVTSRGDDGSLVISIEAWHVFFDLQSVSPLLEFHQANGQIWLHNEWVQMRSTGLWEDVWFYKDQTPDTPAWIQPGSGPPSASAFYDFTLNWETPGSAVFELANILDMDVTYTRGSTAYTIGLSTGANSTLPPVLVTYRKNQINVQRRQTTDGAGTRIYPRGLGDDAFMPSIGTTPITSRRYYDNGSTMPYVVFLPSFEPDQLKGLYLEDVRRPGTYYGPILQSWSTKSRPTKANPWLNYLQRECTAIKFTTSTGTTEQAAGFTDTATWFYLKTSTAGESLNYVPRASSRLSSTKVRPLILDRQDIPVISNLANDDRGYGVDLAGATSTLGSYGPWVGGDPFITRTRVYSSSTTPFVQYGQSAVRCEYTAVGADNSMFANHPTGFPLSTEEPHLSVQTWFYLESGGLQLRMYASGPGSTGTIYFPSSTSPVAKATAVEQWHHIAIAPGAFNFITEYSTIVTEAGITMTALSSGTVAYFDAFQIVLGPVPGAQIVAGSGVEKLWRAANDLYASGIDAIDFYDVGVVDLFRLDPNTYNADEFVPGRNVTLSDVETQVSVTKRISSVSRNLLIEGDSQIEFLDD